MGTLNISLFKAKKKYGQHFLHDASVVEKIIQSASIQVNDIILEIGPGPGILTKALLESSNAILIVVEIDKQFWDHLDQLQSKYPHRLIVLKEDALKLSIKNVLEKAKTLVSKNLILGHDSNLVPNSYLVHKSNLGQDLNSVHIPDSVPDSNLGQNHDKITVENPGLMASKAPQNKLSLESTTFPSKIKIISNLPYNIGTALVINWLEETNLISQIIVMLQKEVVDRLCAKPSTPDYGRLSVITQLKCTTLNLFIVPPQAFAPMPRVNSAVVCLTPYIYPKTIDYKNIEKLIFLLFQNRRKMIGQKLKEVISKADSLDAKEKIHQDILKIGIAFTQRAEELTILQYYQLSQIFNKLL